MLKKCCIYKLISPSGKIYIGQSRNLTARLVSYSLMKKQTDQYLISKEIVEYGFNNFKIEILYVNVSQEEANKLEIELIAYYKNLNVSLNIHKGGVERVEDGIEIYKVDVNGNILAEYNTITKAALANNVINSNISMANKRKTFKCKGGFYIYKEYYLQGWFEKRRTIADVHSRPVIQLTLQGDYVNSYKSSAEAFRKTGIGRANIDCCIKGKSKKAGNFLWIAKTKYDPNFKYLYQNNLGKHSKRSIYLVNQKTLDKIKFSSINEAVDYLNLSRHKVFYAIKHNKIIKNTEFKVEYI